MENVLLEMHSKMDSLQQERKEAQVEAKEAYKMQVQAEKRLEACLADSRSQQKAFEQQVTTAERKQEEKALQLYRVSLTLQAVERKVDDQAKEIARLQQVTKLGESVARLPAACVENLTEDRMRDIKQSALHDALMDL